MTVADVQQAQAWFHQFTTRSTDRDGLYSRLGTVFAADPDLASLLLAARPTQRNPPLVYAAIHHLLLSGVAHPLADHYATITDAPAVGDPGPALRNFVASHRDAITDLVATRSTQTNSIERSTVLLVLLAQLGAEAGPLGLVDVGTSAGGNLLFDRWTHRYVTGAATATVRGRSAVDPPLLLVSQVSGPAPIPTTMPTVAWRLGIDQSPVDVDDPDEVRWVLACVWPSDVARFHRLQRAMEVVRDQRPPVETADAVDDLEAVLADVPGRVHPTVVTSWVLNYLTHDRQREFLAVLDRVGAHRDLSLVTFESPRRTPGLAVPPGREGDDTTVLGWYRWRDGRRSAAHVATAHAHGRWVRWWNVPAGH